MEIPLDLTIWVTVGIFLLISEIFTGTFYLLFAGVAAFLTAIVAWRAQPPLFVDFLIFAVFCVFGALVVKKKFKSGRTGFQSDADRILILTDSVEPGQEKSVSYQGSLWTAVNTSQQSLRAGEKAKIIKVEGIKLVIGPLA